MKFTDGLFLECFQEVAKEYPELKSDDIIVDDLAMKLVIRPQEFDVVVLTNLQGDIISDLCAGLVGGLGLHLQLISVIIFQFLKPFMERHLILPVKILPILQPFF